VYDLAHSEGIGVGGRFRKKSLLPWTLGDWACIGPSPSDERKLERQAY
jgi:hypothetical protein